MRESLRLVTSGYNRPRYDRIGWKVCACRSKKKYYSKLDPSKGVDSTPTRSRRTLSRVFPLTPCITCRMNKNVDTSNDPSNLILRFEYNRVVPFFHQQFLFLLDSLRTKFSRGTKRLKTKGKTSSRECRMEGEGFNCGPRSWRCVSRSGVSAASRPCSKTGRAA